MVEVHWCKGCFLVLEAKDDLFVLNYVGVLLLLIFWCFEELAFSFYGQLKILKKFPMISERN